MAVFRLKLQYGTRESTTKFLYVKTVIETAVKYSLACLSVQKWLVGMSPSTWKFGINWPTAFKNADFHQYLLVASLGGVAVRPG